MRSTIQDDSACCHSNSPSICFHHGCSYAGTLHVVKAFDDMAWKVGHTLSGRDSFPAICCRVSQTLASKLKVDATLEGFKTVPPEALTAACIELAATAAADPATWGPLAFTTSVLAPVPDGHVLPHAPLSPFPAAAAKVDILLGYCKDEFAAILEAVPGLQPDPTALASALGFPQVKT